MISFVIPGLPIAKGRPKISTWGGRARAYTPAKTVAYEGLVAMAGREAMDGTPPLDGPVSVEIVAWFPIAPSWSKKKRQAAVDGTLRHTSRPDGDNLLKVIGDGLNNIVWRDDSQIAEAKVSKRYGDVPGVSVTVVAL